MHQLRRTQRPLFAACLTVLSLSAGHSAAIASEICSLGRANDVLVVEAPSLLMCLENLRRYRGAPDAKGWVYGSYGETEIAVDADAAYRHYREDDSWAVFANVGGLLPLMQRTLTPDKQTTASSAPELGANEALPASSVTADSLTVTNSAGEAETAALKQQTANHGAAADQVSPNTPTQKITAESPAVAASAPNVMPTIADPATTAGDPPTPSTYAAENPATPVDLAKPTATNSAHSITPTNTDPASPNDDIATTSTGVAENPEKPVEPTKPPVAASDPSVTSTSTAPASSDEDIDTPSTQIAESSEAKPEETASTQALSIAPPRVRCQYRRGETWLSSEDFDLASCIARVKAEQQPSTDNRGLTNGYWNGFFIYVNDEDVYTTEDLTGPWSKQP